MEPLENIARAAKVDRIFEVTASDGKRYICEQLCSRELQRSDLNRYPEISDMSKKRLVEALSKELAEGKATPDFWYGEEIKGKGQNHRIPGWTSGSAYVSMMTTYRVEAYKIIRPV